MSNYWQKERNKTSMGDPSSQGKEKGKMNDPFFGDSAKKGKIMKGMEAHDPDSFPTDKGTAKSFKNLRDSEIKKGSI